MAIFYCEGCKAPWEEAEIVDNKCPICNQEPLKVNAALIALRGHGSEWITDIELVPDQDLVVGKAWDATDVGSPYMPDDYRGQYIEVVYPLSWVLKFAE